MHSPRLPPHLAFIVALVFAGSGGWIAGRRLASGHPGAVVGTSGSQTDHPTEWRDDAGQPSPGGAWQRALPAILKKEYFDRREEIAQLIPQLDLTDFPVLLTQIRAQGDKDDPGLYGEVLAWWMERDPAAARAHFFALTSTERGAALAAIAPTWLTVDAESYVAWMRALSPADRAAQVQIDFGEFERMEGAANALHVRFLASRSPVDAFENFQRLRAEGTQFGAEDVAEELFRHWGRRDPLLATQRLAEITDAEERTAAMKGLAGGWIHADQHGSTEWLKTLPASERVELVNDLADSLSRADARRGAEFAWEMAQTVTDSSPPHDSVRGGFVERWFLEDEAGALRWMHELPESRFRRDAFLAAARNAAVREPDGRHAIELWKEADDGVSKIDIGFLAREICHAGGIRATVPLIQQLSGDRLSAAVGWIMGGPMEGEAPEKILDAVSAFPAGPARDLWVERGFHRLGLKRSLAQVEALLPQLSEPEREKAMFAAASVALPREPDIAAGVLEQLPNGHARLLEVTAMWLKSPTAINAEKWLATSTLLSPEEKQELLQRKGALPRP